MFLTILLLLVNSGDGSKVIIDCDAGVDDIYAIQFLLNEPTVEILAITTVDGNVEPDKSAVNVLRLLMANENNVGMIPVYPGHSQPIVETTPKEKGYWFGTDGLDDHPDLYPQPALITPEMIENRTAALALVDIINQYPGEVDLIAIGPLTNIALALNIDPGLGERLKSLTIMGGNAYSLGNAETTLSEYNFFLDVEAAFIVLERTTRQTQVRIISLELCSKYQFPPEMVLEIDQSTVLGRFFKTVSETEIKRMEESLEIEISYEFQGRGFMLCDLYAPIALLHPEAFKTAYDFSVSVEVRGLLSRGMMVVDRTGYLLNKNATAWIPVESDMEKIMALESLRFE